MHILFGSPSITPLMSEPTSQSRQKKHASSGRRRVKSGKENRTDWIRLTSGALLAFVTLLAVAMACAISILRFGFTPVLTNSMTPAFEPGSVAITRPKDTQDLKKGDVIILPLPESNGQRYLHRLLEVRHIDGAIHVTTKGDHNPLPDAWTLEITSATAPVAVGSIPYVGWLANVMRGTLIRLGFAGGIVLLVVVGFKRTRREYKFRRTQRSTPAESPL